MSLTKGREPRPPLPILWAILWPLLVGCPTRPPESRIRSVEDAAAHYRAHHDFESLETVVGSLRLGSSRQQVEERLGPPTYCPVQDEQCYYHSDRKNEAGVGLTLVVEYRIWYVDGREVRVSGRLESLLLGPVGE